MVSVWPGFILPKYEFTKIIVISNAHSVSPFNSNNRTQDWLQGKLYFKKRQTR